MSETAELLQQHLIDPEVCIRCNTCEATCPVGAVTHDERNYVVDADKCNFCMACIPPCPTGSIDNWRVMPRVQAYSTAEQLTWDELPVELSAEAASDTLAPSPQGGAISSAQHSASLPPWSAAHAYTNLYGPKAAQTSITATVTGNVRVTDVGHQYDTHHIVLDFGQMPFPVLEGQSVGIIPPGIDANGRAHHARQYSIASPATASGPATTTCR